MPPGRGSSAAARVAGNGDHGYEGRASRYKGKAGNNRVIVHLDADNSSSDNCSTSIGDFALWDKGGEAQHYPVIGPQAPATYTSKVLDNGYVAPGDQLTDSAIKGGHVKADGGSATIVGR